MKAHPILISAPMVRAILEGQKTQTRRVVKKLPCHNHIEWMMQDFEGLDHLNPESTTHWFEGRERLGYAADRFYLECPYGKPGDVLWVRESFWHARSYAMTLPSGEPQSGNAWAHRTIHYAAEGAPQNTPNRHYPEGLRNGAISAPDPYADWRLRPSIHMPRWASRLTLEITGIRVERLQDMRLQDYEAEGIVPLGQSISATDAIAIWIYLWESINGAGSWGANPWVWVIEFKVHRCNVDEFLKQSAGCSAKREAV